MQRVSRSVPNASAQADGQVRKRSSTAVGIGLAYSGPLNDATNRKGQSMYVCVYVWVGGTESKQKEGRGLPKMLGITNNTGRRRVFWWICLGKSESW